MASVVSDAPAPVAALATTAEPLFALRAPRVEDVPFLRSSWVKSYAKYSVFNDDDEERTVKGPRPARMPAHVYVPEQHALIARILERPSALTVIACNPDDPDQIFGYVVAERVEGQGKEGRNIAHYCYVKEPFRKQGIARELLRVVRVTLGAGAYWASHWSRLIPGKPGYELEFNPFKTGGA